MMEPEATKVKMNKSLERNKIKALLMMKSQELEETQVRMTNLSNLKDNVDQ